MSTRQTSTYERKEDVKDFRAAHQVPPYHDSQRRRPMIRGPRTLYHVVVLIQYGELYPRYLHR